MKGAVVVLIRNDIGQVLLLERWPDDPEYNGPCFPGGKVEVSESKTRAAQREVREETGLEIRGLAELESRPSQSGHYLLTCFTAYVSGGKLIKFPTREHRSASWIAPTLALRIDNLGVAVRAFLEKALRSGLF